VNFNILAKSNAGYYVRYYRLIAAATLIMTAVVSGSLMIGDSVRHTLMRRVTEWIGNTASVVFSVNSFFSEDMAELSLFGGGAKPVLMVNGFISSGGRLIPVMVWGVDNKNIPAGSAKVNPTLAAELPSPEADDIALRLPATGLVPSGSLFVTDNYTTSIRLSYAGVEEAGSGGNMSLKNEQIIPCNIFVNRAELASALEIEGKINLVLSDKLIEAGTLAEAWSPSLSGIKVAAADGFSEISSDRIFLQNDLVSTVEKNNPGLNRLFSYMANSIEQGGESIPYSFVTAVDEYDGQRLSGAEIILSDYAARRLNASANDSVRLTYFVSSDLKTLSEETLALRVSAIIPLKRLLADKTLSAEFPGLSDVEKCTDWDSDMPIDMNLITKDDEDYWTSYRSTPKALVAYNAVARSWGNAYGSATAIRTAQHPNMSGLAPSMLGIQIVHPKEAGLAAAAGGINFGSLFLSLGIFIVFAAILLMLVPLYEMIFVRRNELELMRALGFPARRVVNLMRRESLAVVLISSPAGVVAGACYTALILALLNTLWNGAVHTGGFSFFPSMQSILWGWITGAVIAGSILMVAISRAARRAEKPVGLKPEKARSGKPFSRRRLIWSGLRMNGKRSWMSFAALTSGALIVFSVGLNRRGFADSSQLRSGTGGYSLWCETGVPLYHNINTADGRAKLALTDLPKDVEALQILRYGADDASCLNLNKVSRPTVLGVDMERFAGSDFKILQSIYDKDTRPFIALASAAPPVYPVMIDETTLLWGLQRKLGDTISYEASNGQTVHLLLAASLQNSIFQGNLLMDKTLFSQIWNEITGSEIALIRTADENAQSIRQLMQQALGEYGVQVMPASERLRAFNSVTDAYLTIFLTLGGLGLLVGIASFVIVVRKNLASRREQIELYRSLGFTSQSISALLIAENRIIPVASIAVGVTLSLAGVSGSMANVGAGVWITAIALAAALIASASIFVRKAVESEIAKHNL
jgi:putative ABC transport system permease protein